MKNTFFLFATLGIIFMISKGDGGNVDALKESVNVTKVWSKTVTAARYADTKGFRIKNITSDTIGLWVTMRDQPDSIYWIFTPGWNPEVVKVLCKQAKTVKIGK